MGHQIKFFASYWRSSTNAEGETSIILKVPESDIAAAVSMVRMKQKVLLVTVEKADGENGG